MTNKAIFYVLFHMYSVFSIHGNTNKINLNVELDGREGGGSE
jgi:hypothetical protein